MGLTEIYDGSKGCMKINGMLNKLFSIELGVREGYVFSFGCLLYLWMHTKLMIVVILEMHWLEI